MNKIGLVTSILSISLTASAYALPKAIAPHTHKVQKQSMLKSVNYTSNFANFNGVWKGACQNDIDENTIEIANNEEEIILNGDGFPISGSYTVVSSAKESTETATYNFEWNKDKTELTYQASFSDKSFDYPAFISSAQGSIKLQNDKLIITSAQLNADSNAEVVSCTYTKISD